MLGEYFEKLISDLQNKSVRFVWFDFHHECRKMKWENLSKLVEIIKDDIKSHGYFEFQYMTIKP